MQLSSQSWPNDINEELFKPGKTCVLTLDDDKVEIGRYPDSLEVMVELFGR